MAFGDKFETDIQTKLNTADIDGKLLEQHAAIKAVDAIEQEKALASQAFSGRLRKARKARKALTDAIESGVMTERVVVYLRANEERMEIETVRASDDYVFEELTRPMNAEERQGKFAFDEEPTEEPEVPKEGTKKRRARGAQAEAH